MSPRTLAMLATAVVCGLGAVHARAYADDDTCAQANQAPVTTNHVTQIDGQNVAYTATVGFLHVTAADGQSRACVFYTAYNRTDLPQDPARPLAFAFNGGPGSASLWLHLGALGPERVDMGPQGLTPPQPFSLVTNTSSFLDVMDLVLIDPVNTGFSKPDPGVPADRFFGVKNDYESIGSFVQTYLTAYNRWASPKLVIGESYGGVRGSLLTHYLQRSLGINIDGIIFISPYLASATLNFGDADNDLAYVDFLPTYAATAYYHGKSAGKYLSQSLEQVRAAAESFAFGPYLDALALGNDLSDDQAKQIAQQLADLTGLSLDFVLEHNLRVSDGDFFGALLAGEHKRIGRYDSRFSEGTTGDADVDYIDPANQALQPPFTAAMNSYLINALDWKSANPYIAMGSAYPWPYDSDGAEFGVLDELSAALLDNPGLRVYVATGYYDLAVPFGATKYNFRHLAPGQHLEDRVTLSLFEAGHMVYTNPACLQRLKADVKAFVAKTLAPPAA